MLPRLPPLFTLKQSRLPRWLQYALMLLAGAGSFYAAVQLGPHSTPEDGGVELRKKSVAGTAPPSSTTTQVVFPMGDSASKSIAAPRMDAGVLQNPFGALNLSVTVESLSQPVPAPAGVAVAAVAKVIRPVKQLETPPPPVVVLAPPPLPEPVAPPLPYRVVGSIQGVRIGDGAPVVFLSDRGNTLVVRAGDEIDNTYRVEHISADKVEFTYLPLKTIQWLPIAR